MKMLLRIAALVAVPAGGFGAGFFVFGEAPEGKEEPMALVLPENNSEYLEIGPLLITFVTRADSRDVKIGMSLEVEGEALERVSSYKLRFHDHALRYISGLDPEELLRPEFLNDIRYELLSSFQLLSGRDDIRDVLFTSFIVN